MTDAEIIAMWGGPTNQSNKKIIVAFARKLLEAAHERMIGESKKSPPTVTLQR